LLELLGCGLKLKHCLCKGVKHRVNRFIVDVNGITYTHYKTDEPI